MISVRYNQLFTTLTMLCILLRFYLFKNVSNTSSLIAKEIKTNINLISTTYYQSFKYIVYPLSPYYVVKCFVHTHTRNGLEDALATK